VRRGLALLVALTACAPPSPGPHVQGLLDEYAPELIIGGSLSVHAREKYRLEPVSEGGYRDSSFAAPDGIVDLFIAVDKPGEVLAREVSASARIVSVRFRITDSITAQRLRVRFDSALGTPEPICRRTSEGVFRERYWPGMRDRGIDLTERLGGDAVVTFGSSKPHTDSAAVVPCRSS
jgi:hypothetical protein